MASVDSRVVEMIFDNSMFEQKLATTMGSLDKLQTKLSMTGAQEGLANVATAANNFDMSNMESSVQNISDKFSILGAVGFTVIQDLTRAVGNFAGSIASKVLGPIVTKGRGRAENLEQARFLFEGLDMDIEASMASANAAVTGTAYGLDAAAKAAAQLGGSGLRAGDEMTGALRGIAGIAAMTNSSYEEMADIFITAAGNGKVMSNELGRISHRGVNAAAALGKVWGKTEEEVRAMATEGEISFEMFAQGMDAAFGEHAQKANETYTGSLANLQSALGRIGASFFGPHMERQRDLFNALRPLVDGVAKAMGPLIDAFNDVARVKTDKIIEFLNAIRLTELKNAGVYFARAFKNIIKVIDSVITPIKEAFQDIFPRDAFLPVLAFSISLERLTRKLILSEEQADKVKRIFSGIFAALEIGWTILKSVAGLFGNLFSSFSDANGEGILNFFLNLSDSVVELNEKLVAGGGIERFFETVGDYIYKAVDAAVRFKEAVADMFSSFEMPSGNLGRVNSRIENIGDTIDWLADRLSSVGNVLSEVWSYMSGWFSELGEKLAAVMQPGDFNAVTDALNVGLLGGIILLLKQFFAGGVDFRLTTGVIENMRISFINLSRQLQAMQMDLRAKALLKIAAAVALLAASVLVFSMIDSVKLTKALTAMTIGFGQLVGSMHLLNSIDMSGSGAAKMTALAVGMVAIAVAALILAAAVKILSSMNWEELSKGLIGVTVLMGVLTQSAKMMQGSTSGMIRAGIGIMFIAVAMNILAAAMKIFATMSWDELGKGLAGVAGGLAGIVAAVNLMPKGMAAKGFGILMIAVAMNAMAAAMKIFATMSWEEMGKGLAGVAGGLVSISLAMRLMPAKSMMANAAAILIISVSLNILADAMKSIADMSWAEMGQGLAGIAASLLILAVASNVMAGAVAGAVAIGIMAVSLDLMVDVIKAFSSLSIGQMIKGLIGMAVTLGVLAGMSILLGAAVGPMIGLSVAMLSLSAAMFVLGAGFALFGGGALLLAKSLETLVSVGKKGIKVLIFALEEFIIRLPAIAGAFALALAQFAMTFLEAAPPIVKAVGVLVGHILDTIIELAPKMGETLTVLVQTLLQTLRDTVPDFVETGLELLLALLTGIRDNIGEITTLVGEITVNFIEALEEQVPPIASALGDLLITVVEEAAKTLGLVAGTLLLGIGQSFLDGFWEGISSKVTEIYGNIEGFIKDVINWFKSGFGIFSPSTVMHALGIDLIVGLLNGILEAAIDVTKWFKDLAVNTFNWIGTVTRTLLSKGWDLIEGILKGVHNFVTQKLKPWFTGLGAKVFGWIGTVTKTLKTKGWNLVVGLYNGVISFINEKLIPWFSGLKDKVLGWLGDTWSWLRTAGRNIVIGLWNGINDKIGWLMDKVNWLAEAVKNPFAAAVELLSPSKVFYRYGVNIGEGLVLGIDAMIKPTQRASKELGEEVVDAFSPNMSVLSSTLSKIPDAIDGMNEFHPTITPVLDLTNVQKNAKKLNGLVTSSTITPDLSYAQANSIASTAISQNGSDSDTVDKPTEVKFEQNNYSPTQLSTADIYRQTRNQVTLAKEELSIR